MFLFINSLRFYCYKITLFEHAFPYDTDLGHSMNWFLVLRAHQIGKSDYVSRKNRLSEHIRWINCGNCGIHVSARNFPCTRETTNDMYSFYMLVKGQLIAKPKRENNGRPFGNWHHSLWSFDSFPLRFKVLDNTEDWKGRLMSRLDDGG